METFKRTIVIGNEANLVKPAPKHEDEPTHKWRVFVHGPDNEDISSWVKQINFELHHTFHQPTRMRPNRPYEVDERGWGEFDVQVTLYVRGHETHPYCFTHPLKLHSSRTKRGKPEYPFFSCAYHDFNVSGVSKECAALLQANPQTTERPTLRGQEPEMMVEEKVPVFYPEVEHSEMGDAHLDVKHKIQQSLNLYLRTQKEIEKTKAEIRQLEDQQNYAFGNAQFVQVPLKEKT